MSDIIMLIIYFIFATASFVCRYKRRNKRGKKKQR